MRIFTILLAIFMVGSVWAQVLDISLLMESVSKDQIKESIQMLEKMGNISREEAKKALLELERMNSGEIDALKSKAVGKIQEEGIPSPETALLSQQKTVKSIEKMLPPVHPGAGTTESSKRVPASSGDINNKRLTIGGASGGKLAPTKQREQEMLEALQYLNK